MKLADVSVLKLLLGSLKKKLNDDSNFSLYDATLIKRSLIKSLTSQMYSKLTLSKRTPLSSGCRHPLNFLSILYYFCYTNGHLVKFQIQIALVYVECVVKN